MEDLLKRDFESVSFSDLSRLWECSPEEAERYFELTKHEAQKEFCAGHLAAKVFEPADWLGSVWLRAQFLAVRDSFILEYNPDGGIEFALIDLLAMSFFVQNYWAEMSVKRTMTSPRRESQEFVEWNGYRSDEAKRRRFDDGQWVVPWVSEEHALRTATEMFDHFSRLFQRTLRQLNNHRIAKLKGKETAGRDSMAQSTSERSSSTLKDNFMISGQPMNEKTAQFLQAAEELGHLPSPPRSYSTHPRVQKAFRRLVNWRKFEEQQNAKQSSPDTSLVSRMLTPSEQEQVCNYPHYRYSI
jgi:hypothetical protein